MNNKTAPLMSTNSRSFLRFREYSKAIGDVNIMMTESKRDILDFMHRFNINQRAVFFAENIQTLTKEEVKYLVTKLANKLEKEQGVIEFHPTGDDTSKSAHIHWWGIYNNKVEDIISNFIKYNRLSNKLYLNYTNSDIKVNKLYKNVRSKIIKKEFIEKNISEEEIAYQNDLKPIKYDLTSYDEITAYYNEILEIINFKLKNNQNILINKNSILGNIDYDSINNYLEYLDLEY